MQCKKCFFIELNNREETLGHDIFVHRSIPSENQCQLALNYWHFRIIDFRHHRVDGRHVICTKSIIWSALFDVITLAINWNLFQKRNENESRFFKKWIKSPQLSQSRFQQALYEKNSTKVDFLQYRVKESTILYSKRTLLKLCCFLHTTIKVRFSI